MAGSCLLESLSHLENILFGIILLMNLIYKTSTIHQKFLIVYNKDITLMKVLEGHRVSATISTKRDALETIITMKTFIETMNIKIAI